MFPSLINGELTQSYENSAKFQITKLLFKFFDENSLVKWVIRMRGAGSQISYSILPPPLTLPQYLLDIVDIYDV